MIIEKSLKIKFIQKCKCGAVTIRFTGETSKMSWAALPVEPACIGKTCGGKRGVRSCSLDWLGRQIIYKHIRRYEY